MCGLAERLNAYFWMKLVAQRGTITQTPLCAKFVPRISVDHWVRGVWAYYYLGFRPRRPLALHRLGLYLFRSLFSDQLFLLTRFAKRSLELQHYLKSLRGQREFTITRQPRFPTEAGLYFNIFACSKLCKCLQSGCKQNLRGLYGSVDVVICSKYLFHVCLQCKRMLQGLHGLCYSLVT